MIRVDHIIPAGAAPLGGLHSRGILFYGGQAFAFEAAHMFYCRVCPSLGSVFAAAFWPVQNHSLVHSAPMVSCSVAFVGLRPRCLGPTLYAHGLTPIGSGFGYSYYLRHSSGFFGVARRVFGVAPPLVLLILISLWAAGALATLLRTPGGGPPCPL